VSTPSLFSNPASIGYAEGFNVTNRVTFAAPAQLNPRKIQIGARLVG
jgi:hypothetical protein